MVLYLGRVMETAPQAALYAAPRHPYTRALLAANPVPDPGRGRVVVPVASEGPEQADNPGGGCVFRNRCPLAIARCAQELPALRTVGESLVACHRAEE
jgi:oligopeptide/dipeptide ABC transporter ATP-binding protein